MDGYAMTPRDLLQAGKLDEAIDALSAEVRDNPTDTRRRTFLFELLCFAGEYDRAQKHLDVLAGAGLYAATGALLNRAALHADPRPPDPFPKREHPPGPETEEAATAHPNG